ncbi:hypothetical protein COB64_02275 [Candidatus Wolfebacteria bacterium]|nr:MAG: hypothetical protein COB64_02275 [Candidatus Wolfebacteria bacterium]
MKISTNRGASSIVVLIVVVIAIAATLFFINKQNAQPEEISGVLKDAVVSEAGYVGEVLAGTSSLVLDFNQVDYDKAIESDKLVVLYFFATWCPICIVEVENELFPAFDELTTDQVVGFRINFNDTSTSDEEKALAREFGIAFQHTKVFVKNGERILKTPESWEKAQYLEEINGALSL